MSAVRHCLAVISCGPLIWALSSPALAYEPKITRVLVASKPLADDSHGRYEIYREDIDLTTLKAFDAIEIDVPIKGQDLCEKSPRELIPFFVVYHRDAGVPFGQYQEGTTTYAIEFEHRQVVLDVKATPSKFDGSLYPEIGYRYPLLDPLPFQPCATPDADMKFSLIFNRGNSFVSISYLGSPIAPVYSSPINIGVGGYIYGDFFSEENSSWHLTIGGFLDSNSGVELAGRDIELYGVYWTYDKSVARSRSNFLDDLNLQYGGKALPVRSPVLDRGWAAAAAIYEAVLQ